MSFARRNFSIKLLIRSLITICCIYILYTAYKPARSNRVEPRSSRLSYEGSNDATLVRHTAETQTKAVSKDSAPRSSRFPAKLWQKTSTSVFSKRTAVDLGSWRQRNPFFNFNLLSDQQSDDFVRERFKNHPEIVDVYLSLQIPIVKADLVRYLFLIAEGGVWADLDVACEKPVDEWLPSEYMESNIELVVGVELEGPWRGVGETLMSQFASWTVMAKPGNKHLQHVVESAIGELQAIAKENRVGIDGLQLGMLPDVIDVSGPMKMTLGIIESVSQLTGHLMDDRDFAKLTRPKVIGDVLILPGAAFAAFQNGYPEDQGDPLVTHHYAGSWKADADKGRKEYWRKKQEQFDNSQKRRKDQKVKD